MVDLEWGCWLKGEDDGWCRVPASHRLCDQDFLSLLRWDLTYINIIIHSVGISSIACARTEI